MDSQLLLNGRLPPVRGSATTIDENKDISVFDISVIGGIVYSCQQQGKI